MRAVTTSVLMLLLLAPPHLLGQEETTPGVPLHLAALTGNVDAVRRHISAGTDLNEKDAYGSTPLIIAATFGRTEVARALIQAGADLDITNSDGGSALHAAAFLCRPEIVHLLLAGGSDKRLRDNFGNTPAESVAAPFDEVVQIYDAFAQGLAPLGLVLDYEQIRATRPRIAEMLRPTRGELAAVDFRPAARDDWPVSTPAAQGLDPRMVAELYYDAAGLSTLYGMLVVKNGRLVAEKYFNEGSVDQLSARQSVTKSYTSALVGLALEQGYLTGVDQKMMDFFPELAGEIRDPRKGEITIGHLLQMRAGYPWDEAPEMREYFDALFFSDDWHWLPHIVGFPLVSEPGAEWGYSNLTSHLLAVIVARAVDRDLASWGQENLFSPIDAEVGEWSIDDDGYRFGSFELSVTARDMAKFGSLYLNGGVYRGRRIVPADWVEESLRPHSEHLDVNRGRYFRDIGYGYQWWSATAGGHRFDYAAGHGGNLIVLLHDLEMVIVTTADPLYEFPTQEAAPFEGPILNVVGKFIASLPVG